MEIKELKHEEAKCDVPLTLAQLRKMFEINSETIGCPIIVSENGILSHAVLDARVDDGICAVVSANEHWLKEKDYGKTWIAYAYPPKHIDLEAWEPCENCNPRCAICANYGGWDRYGKPKICEDCKSLSNFIADDEFCSYCGRPLTPKARAELEKRLRG